MERAISRITWVNHASFIYSQGHTRLLCDPWLTGTAFNNGWRHISETRFQPADFADITHIWISHQHPDHFAPLDLRRVAREDRERIAVLYQSVPDKLVVSWLRSNGYKRVRDLEMDRWVRLTDDVEILCGSLADDSWLAIRGANGTVLNVNDCVLKRRADIEEIARLAGPVNVLLTQFSYAQWSGNADETAVRQADAREKYDRIRLQCEILNPNTVVPFASFVYFSNTENFFMNDSMNHVGDIARFIEDDLKKEVVVLYPGETWQLGGAAADWRPAAARYEADVRARLAGGPLDVPAQIPAQQFAPQINEFLRRVRKKNPLLPLLMREQTTFYATDQSAAYVLTSAGVRQIDARPDEVDVATASENIAYAIRMPWGGNTLHVSGRFQSHVPGAHLRFFRVLAKLHYFNKTAVDYRWLLGQFARIRRGALRRIGRIIERASTRLRGGPSKKRATA